MYTVVVGEAEENMHKSNTGIDCTRCGMMVMFSVIRKKAGYMLLCVSLHLSAVPSIHDVYRPVASGVILKTKTHCVFE